MKPNQADRPTLKKKNGQTFISSHFLCERFSIAPGLMRRGLRQAGIRGHWLDADAFTSLSYSPDLALAFNDKRRALVLKLLEGFQEKAEDSQQTKAASCPHHAGDPSSCELAACYCLQAREAA